MNDKQFLASSQKLSEFIVEYNRRLEGGQLPVVPSRKTIQPGYLRRLLPDRAPENGQDFADILDDLERCIMPGVTHWHHPDFFAYFPTAKSYPSILGDMISGAIACIGFSWISSPACTELEVIVLDWLVRAMHLPETFLSTSDNGGGVIQTSASMSTALIIMSVRSHLQREHQVPSSRLGRFSDSLVVYFSEEAHSSVERACNIGLVQYRAISTLTSGNHGMNHVQLKAQIIQDIGDGLIPAVVVATLGSTGSCAFDSLREIGNLCEEYKIWLHVDAAYFGTGLLCPEYRHLAEGIEKVDSFNVNLHKLGLVIFDCSILYTRNKRLLTDSFISNPEYLKHDQESVMPEYRHWDINLGRRFRSLKIWFVVRTYGLEGMRSFIRKHTQLAREFSQLLRADDNFEIVNRVDFGLVCFRAKGSDSLNKLLYSEIVKEQKIFLVTSMYKTHENTSEKYFLRLTPSVSTNNDHILHAYEHIKGLLNGILDSQGNQ